MQPLLLARVGGSEWSQAAPSTPTLLSLGSLATWTLQRGSHAAKRLVGTRAGLEAVSGPSQPGSFVTGLNGVR